MPKGGARSRSGPKPDPNALRRLRKDDAGWTTLPSEGRTDPAPEWPLTEATGRELVIWERWWRKPEALLWESDGSADYVALTVRMFSEAEVEKASAENRKTVRMMMADLYLTRDAKDRARIRIAADETAEKRDEKAAATPSAVPSARERFEIVNGGA
jgi:hypothetical protein